ncbi:MAG: hypothetical protein NTNFB01_11810 [Nitrospira sp.]
MPIEHHAGNLIEGASGRQCDDQTEDPCECAHASIIPCNEWRKQTEANECFVANQWLGMAPIGKSGNFDAAAHAE